VNIKRRHGPSDQCGEAVADIRRVFGVKSPSLYVFIFFIVAIPRNVFGKWN
jgi:hypothetical protein